MDSYQTELLLRSIDQTLQHTHETLVDISHRIERSPTNEDVKTAADDVSTTVGRTAKLASNLGVRISNEAQRVVVSMAVIAVFAMLAHLSILLLILWRVW